MPRMTRADIEKVVRGEHIPEDHVSLLAEEIYSSFGGEYLNEPEARWIVRYLKGEPLLGVTKERFVQIFQEEGVEAHWIEAYWDRAIQRKEMLDEKTVRALAKNGAFGDQGGWM